MYIYIYMYYTYNHRILWIDIDNITIPRHVHGNSTNPQDPCDPSPRSRGFSPQVSQLRSIMVRCPRKLNDRRVAAIYPC